MLTEPWDLGHALDRPPRWSPDSSPRPPVVYLDQWVWDALALDRAGRPRRRDDSGSYALLKDLTHAGEIVVPLSQAHYQENWVRRDADARWDTAVVMAELSGFTTMSPTGLADWENQLAIAEYFSLDIDVSPPGVLGWGHHHCIHGTERSWAVLNSRTGTPIEASLLKSELHPQLVDELPYRVELAVLALHDPEVLRRAGVPAPAPIPKPQVAADFQQEQARIRDAIDRYGRSQGVVRNSVLMTGFAAACDGLHEAAMRHGLDWFDAMDQMARLEPAERIGVIGRVIATMPVHRTYTELRLRAHLDGHFAWRESDGMDFFAMAQAMPFVDVVVTDKKCYDLIKKAGIDAWHGVRVLKSLNGLATLGVTA